MDREAGAAVGYCSLMRIEPVHRVIEVGNILYLPCLQRTVGATEAMYLVARYVFEELGYRRYEWKCDALNAPSRRAALRLGFTFEGIFRQHTMVKGKNRDTAWYSILDTEWGERKRMFEKWLDVANSDAEGKQRSSLAKRIATEEHRVIRPDDPSEVQAPSPPRGSEVRPYTEPRPSEAEKKTLRLRA